MTNGIDGGPHSGWADVYDEVYEQTFGAFYRALTEATLKVVGENAIPGARIVDFGAGTGRLAVPLAKSGYKVLAVEPSKEMLVVLKRKADAALVAIDTVQVPMREAKGDGSFNFATCVFTVIAYVLDEDGLLASFRAAADHLRPGGRLLLDVPSREVFASITRTSGTVQRKVVIKPVDGNIFEYVEDTRVLRSGAWETFKDKFHIRHWPAQTVQDALHRAGFRLERDLSEAFIGAGAQYWLCRKGGEP